MVNGYRPESTRWYNKTWLVLLLCLLFFPVGFYGLWKSRRLPSPLKAMIVGCMGYLLYRILILNYFYQQ
jgi:hypothetical protein